MKRNIWIVALVATVAVLGIVVVKQNRRAAELKEQLALATAEKAKTVPAAAPKHELTEPVPETQTTEPTPSTPGPSPTAQSSSGPTNNSLSGFAKMMKDPAMKEMMRVQQKMAIDQMYSGFFKDLNLSGNQLDALKALLEERQMALMEAGMSAMSGSEAERKQAGEQAKAVKTDYDNKLKELLGPQDYELFQQYEQIAPERMQVQMFKGALSGDVALTEQQEYDLIAAMHEERKAVPSSYASQLTEEGIAEALKQLEQLQQRYADRAAAILTPEQLEQFTKWQQQISAMQAASMKMAGQMFGSKSQTP